MPTKDEIFEKVQEVLVDALSMDDDEVTPEATLVGDLGAESIDFLDIVFNLEKSFDIKIPRGEIFPQDVFTDAELVQDGKITPAGLDELKKRMPYFSLDALEENPVVQDFAKHLTVQDMCNFIAWKLEEAN